MAGELSVDADDVVTWAPILISLIALYYSQKAIRWQIFEAQRRRVEAINLRVVKAGLEIRNPGCLPLDRAEITYHHKRRGTFVGKIDGARLAFPVLVVNFLLDREEQRQARFGSPAEWLRAADELMSYRVYARPKKIKAGYSIIVEMLLTDAARERWYLNTAGAMWHIPRRVIPKAVFFALLSLRLIGYPFWRRISNVNWGNILVASLLTAVVWDHYFNQGQLLLRVLLALGARQV